MKQTVTTGIVLTRTNYGEADRILTVLTPTGKVRLLAKGVRKIKSRLAGGVELFSVSELTFLQGKSELHTLISGRLKQHFGNIVKDMNRTMFAYEALKTINKVLEDDADEAYFNLLEQTLEILDDVEAALDIIRMWFLAQLLSLGGYAPNLITDPSGKRLVESDLYAFSYDDMAFICGHGNFSSRDIKLLRIIFSQHSSSALRNLQADSIESAVAVSQLVRTMAQQASIT